MKPHKSYVLYIQTNVKCFRQALCDDMYEITDVQRTLMINDGCMGRYGLDNILVQWCTHQGSVRCWCKGGKR